MKCSGRKVRPRANQPGFDQARIRHDEPRQAGAEQEAPFEHEVGGQSARRPGPHPEHGEDDGCRGAHHVEDPLRPCVRLAARRGQEGDGGPGHEIEQPGVGAVVDPRGIHPRVEQRRHQHRRTDAEGDGDDDAGAAPAAAGEMQEEEEHEGPDQVELLLDRQ